METYVEFRSDRFPAYEWKTRRINPGRHGKRLADHLRAGLADAGFAVREPTAGDWGWVVPVRHDGFRLWVGCGNYDQHPGDGFLCFIEPHTPTVRRWPWFRRVDASGHVAAVRAVIDRVLDDAGVRQKQWSTHAHFNGATP